MLGSWAIKMIMRMRQPESDVTPASQENATSNQPQPREADSAQRPLYVSDSNPKVAVVSELAQPWSSKRFFLPEFDPVQICSGAHCPLAWCCVPKAILLGLFSASAVRSV